MRLRKKLMDYVAQTVTASLLDKELLTLDGSEETLTAEIRRLITEDLMVEDRLNDPATKVTLTRMASKTTPLNKIFFFFILYLLFNIKLLIFEPGHWPSLLSP